MDYAYSLLEGLLAGRPEPAQHPWELGELHTAGMWAVQPIAMSAQGCQATARRFARREQAKGRLDG